jgi:hypothetical protein
MPPEGYTTVTISDELAAKLAEIVVEHDLESMAGTVDYTADVAHDPETLSDAELAHFSINDPQTEACYSNYTVICRAKIDIFTLGDGYIQVVEPRDVDAIANGLEKSAFDPAIQRRVGRAA